MSRVMGLDVGEARVGVAFSDPTRTIGSAHSVLKRARRPEQDMDALAALVEEHEVAEIVVGWPLMMNGREGLAARRVSKLADALQARCGLPIHKWDERLSTVAAERALAEGGVRGRARRQVVDKVAAALILQGWLDAQPKPDPEP